MNATWLVGLVGIWANGTFGLKRRRADVYELQKLLQTLRDPDAFEAGDEGVD